NVLEDFAPLAHGAGEVEIEFEQVGGQFRGGGRDAREGRGRDGGGCGDQMVQALVTGAGAVAGAGRRGEARTKDEPRMDARPDAEGRGAGAAGDVVDQGDDEKFVVVGAGGWEWGGDFDVRRVVENADLGRRGQRADGAENGEGGQRGAGN